VGDDVGDDAADSAGSADGFREINAVTLAVTDMDRSVAFYRDLGLPVAVGGAGSPFTTLQAGRSFVNLQLVERYVPPGGVSGEVWGRVIVWVDDVDAVYARALATGHRPEFPPTDAPWGERYFHLRDPDGHELSFARRLAGA
jgi:catechol 2,3-dioxygenase-like lactoylglutathione lyase family enzyme